MNNFLHKYIKYKNKYVKLKTDYDELLINFKQNGCSDNLIQNTESDNLINETNWLDKIMFDQLPIQNAGSDNIIYIGKDAESNNLIQSEKNVGSSNIIYIGKDAGSNNIIQNTGSNNIIQNAGSNNIIQNDTEFNNIIQEQTTFNDVFINNKITNKKYNNINARLFLNYQDEIITENSELSIFNSS